MGSTTPGVTEILSSKHLMILRVVGLTFSEYSIYYKEIEIQIAKQQRMYDDS